MKGNGSTYLYIRTRFHAIVTVVEKVNFIYLTKKIILFFIIRSTIFLNLPFSSKCFGFISSHHHHQPHGFFLSLHSSFWSKVIASYSFLRANDYIKSIALHNRLSMVENATVIFSVVSGRQWCTEYIEVFLFLLKLLHILKFEAELRSVCAYLTHFMQACRNEKISGGVGSSSKNVGQSV